MAPIFPDFRKIRKRMKRSLNYGPKPPSALNFPLSELVVDYFDEKCKFDYMEPATSTAISKRGYADPCSLVVALVYLDRLRLQNKKFFESTDPTALYLPALVLASKVLHDADTYDRVSNSGWAENLEMDAEELNNMEWDFVKNLNWDVAVKNEEFEEYLSKMENCVAKSFVEKNGFCTYNELVQLSSSLPILQLLAQFVEFISAASVMYCLTIALMTSTAQRLFETNPSTSLSDHENSTGTIHFYQKMGYFASSEEEVWDNFDGLELDLNSIDITNNDDATNDMENSTSSILGFCDQFKTSFAPIFSCHRPNFNFLVK